MMSTTLEDVSRVWVSFSRVIMVCRNLATACMNDGMMYVCNKYVSTTETSRIDANAGSKVALMDDSGLSVLRFKLIIFYFAIVAVAATAITNDTAASGVVPAISFTIVSQMCQVISFTYVNNRKPKKIGPSVPSTQVSN
jgi:hypothetical protein